MRLSEKPDEINFNEASPFMDLSPLYGFNPDETMLVRDDDPDKPGMLRPDCFAEHRVEYLTPTVSALLILFNRHHNVRPGTSFRKCRWS